LGWSNQYAWFYRDLNGYPLDIQCPEYRQVKGNLVWEPDSNMYNNIQWKSEKEIYGKAREDIHEEETTLDVWSGIDWIQRAAQYGSREETGETTKSYLRSGDSITLKQVRIFPAANFSYCVSNIKRITFDFASQAYIQLKFGNAIQSIFDLYRSSIEAKLSELGLSNHLTEIERGLLSDNPESWRSVAYECRSLLADVANFLWRDPRPTYEYLRNKDGEKLKVTKQESANRLQAYLHQKGFLKKLGKFIRDEVERLWTSIRSLFSYQSKAHSPVSRDDSLTIALSTYFLLGELVLKTDMQPIEQYGQPSPEME
jgi:hypothetical protein